MAPPASSADVTYEKRIMIAVPITFATFATAVFLLRIYARRLTVAKYGTDDFLMGIGLLLSFGATFATVWKAFNGVGMDPAVLSPQERQRFALGSYLLQKFWPTSLAFIKSSIIIFMQRIFHANKPFYIGTTFLMVLVCLWALSAILVNTFQCTPVNYFWNKKIKGGHCIKGQVQFYETMGSLSLITDVLIWVAPMPVIYRLRLDMRRRIALMIIFSISSLVWIFSLLRILYFRKFEITNLSLSSVLETIFTCLEIDIAIFCGCLPALQPLFRRVFPHLTTNKYSDTPDQSRGPLSTGLSSKAFSGRFKRKTQGPFEDTGFEMMVDGKSYHEQIYGIAMSDVGNSSQIGKARDVEDAPELGRIAVRTDLNQNSVKKDKDDSSDEVPKESWLA